MGSKLRRTVEKRDLRLKGLKEPSRQGPAGQTCRAEGTPQHCGHGGPRGRRSQVKLVRFGFMVTGTAPLRGRRAPRQAPRWPCWPLPLLLRAS